MNIVDAAPMEASYVVKRNGEHAPVRFDAITDRNQVLCSAAYGRSLDYVEKLLPAITQEVVRRFKNGMTTHDLDMLTAAVCAAQSTRHQDFSDLAARIIVSDLQKRTATSFVETVRRLDAAVNAEGLNISRLHPEFVGIAERAAAEIDRRIDFARDFRFTCFGIQTMLRSYLLREAGQGTATVERPQHTYMRVALALCVGQPDRGGHQAPEDLFRERLERAFEVYDLLSTQRLTHASPTMFNAGTKHSQLSSCYLLGVDDDLNVLLQVDKDAGMISKWAGGIGVCLTRMRAEGALIKSTGGKSSGLRRYIVKLNSGQLYVNQGGLRPGAYALYLETWHADIFTFLEMGRFKGVAVNAPDLKYALWVNDMFMEAVVEEVRVKGALARGEPVDEKVAAAAGNWYLFSPDRAPGLDQAYGDEFRALYRRYVEEKRYERVVKASAVMTEWFKTVAQKGNPYILFKDHINRKSNLSHYRTITNSNLCVSGETRILTDAGQLPIGDLADQEVRVWNGGEWSAVTVRQTARAAALVRVVLNNGAALDCTPEHKFYDFRGAEHRAGALAPGTRLEKASAWPVVDGGVPFAHAYTHGLYTADGHLHRGRPAIQLYGDKQALLDDPRFEINEGSPGLYVDDDLERTTVFLPPGLPPKFTVPVNASLESRLRWFEGFCDGDACVARNGSSLALQAWSTELDFLRQVRLMLQTMGCDPNITGGRPARVARIRERDYTCRETWRLLVNGTDLWTLIGLGFAPARLDFAGGAPPNRDARRFAQVVSVTPLEETAPTYCFTEPLRSRGVFEGVLAGNCAEITIPCFYEEGKEDEAEYGTCNLGAIPLASFVVPDARADNPGRVRVDWQALITAAGVAVRNLDNVIDINFYPVEACRRSNMKHRPVALGVMGLADVLAKFRYAYGSPEARALDRALHAAVYYGAMAASSRLGEERGNFASFEGSAAQRGLLQPDLWVECGHLDADGSSWEAEVAGTTGGALAPEDWAGLRARCSKFLRNSYVTADMPTATSSQATGQNECFEPFTSNLYTRKTLAGEFTLLNPHLLAELEALGLWDEEMRRALIASAGSVQGIARVPADLRRRYRTARELDQRLLTLHAKARNPFLSQTQSLNYYFGEPLLRDALTVLVKGWQEGLTTGCYYMHTQPAAGSAKTSVARIAPPAYGRQSPPPDDDEDDDGRRGTKRSAPTGVVCTEDVCTVCSV
jgi:ribonucleoside-diphosphate reductase alpha chain